ncbi:hypothetical protein EAE96_011261 [Botrytis aclada]|nr:hypothetical protein EAE96_011261 [Botrytis aclada]
MAAETHTTDQALATNPLESGREIYQVTQEYTPEGKLLTRHDGIQESKTSNLWMNRANRLNRVLLPLATAASKEELMEHLEIDSETYALMVAEVDLAYGEFYFQDDLSLSGFTLNQKEAYNRS